MPRVFRSVFVCVSECKYNSKKDTAMVSPRERYCGTFVRIVVVSLTHRVDLALFLHS